MLLNFSRDRADNDPISGDFHYLNRRAWIDEVAVTNDIEQFAIDLRFTGRTQG